MNHIPMVDFKREFPEVQREVREAFDRVLAKQWFVLGEELREFQREFASYLGAKYAIGVNSGSDALFLAIKALGIEDLDEVITVGHTHTSTTDAIVRNGAKPVFVEVDPASYNVDTSKIEKRITKKTKAILPVHLYGNPAQMDLVLELAKKHRLAVVEDACQAHGATYGKKKVGTFGDIGCFSFYPSKNLGGYGDGGMMITSDERLADSLLKLREYGQSERYVHEFVGVNSRLDELQAAVLRVKLKHLDKWNNNRRRRARLYFDLLQGYDIVTPIEEEHAIHVYHLYVIRCKHRDDLREHLYKLGIQTQIHYPIPVHKQRAYSLIAKGTSLPVTEKICREIVSLPMHSQISEEEVEHVASSIMDFERTH